MLLILKSYLWHLSFWALALPNAEELPISDIERFHIALDFQMAARYAANKQINLKKMEASFREMIERLDCPEEGRS